jgi:RimJ/RimL family protein N-acetyltransferase
MWLELRPPTIKDVEQVRLWRNEILNTLRTPYPLTEKMQGDFYEKVICNRASNHYYWSVYNKDLIGFGGLTNIEWENGLAEISLILSAGNRGQGHGLSAVQLIIDEGFGNMGLRTIYGECYQCNPAIEFWRKVTKYYGGYYTMIPRRKMWQCQLYDALHFSIWR